MEAVAREDHHGSLHPVGAFAFHQPVCLGSVKVCVGRSVRGDLPIDQEMGYPNEESAVGRWSPEADVVSYAVSGGTLT